MILVVEDEPLIRLEAVDIIEELGFTVLQAGNAAEALMLMEHRDAIAVLFTDIDMPGKMNGLELAGLVHERWPNVEIIVASGVTMVSEAKLPKGAVFLPKPYPEVHVTSAVRDAADRAAGTAADQT